MKETKLSETGNALSDDNLEKVTSEVLNEVHLGEHKIRKDAAKKIIDLFKMANIFVLVFLVILVIADWVIIYHSEKIDLTHRLIDKEVIMALLAATTIQLGTIMFTISRSIFPVNQQNNSNP